MVLGKHCALQALCTPQVFCNIRLYIEWPTMIYGSVFFCYDIRWIPNYWGLLGTPSGSLQKPVATPARTVTSSPGLTSGAAQPVHTARKSPPPVSPIKSPNTKKPKVKVESVAAIPTTMVPLEHVQVWCLNWQNTFVEWLIFEHT